MCCGGKGGAYDRGGLKRYYDRVAHMLRINPLPESLREQVSQDESVRGRGRQADRRGPAALHLSAPGRHVRRRRGRADKPGTCTGCGNCTIGCPEGAKNTLDLNYLALAESAGVEVRTLCEVESLADYGGHLHVRYIDHRSGEPDAVDAEYVFLCAGAVG